MFRPPMGHPQALKENRSKITYMFYRNEFCERLGSHNAFLLKVETCRPVYIPQCI